MPVFHTLFFEYASDFISAIPDADKAKVMASIKIMETDIAAVKTKTLRRETKELVVKKYRLLFFIKGNTIYIVSGFVKKTQKTPAYEIERAEGAYKMMQ